MKIAYQGVLGAFSHEACLAFAPGYEPVATPDFAAVIGAVESGEAELGMLPFENSGVGPVEEVHALLARSSLMVKARHPLPVRLHLLGLKGAGIESVRTAVSHPMALKQCAGTLERLGITGEAATNTAGAAQSLADPARAVLASEAAASVYGLTILRRDVHDRPDNTTIFVVVGRDAA